MKRRRLAAAGLALCASVACASAAELNPAAVGFKLPDQIAWTGSGGARSALIAGDPAKPGMYVQLLKWLPGNMSRPHFHNNDRFFVVVKGTWWVGTGSKFDPDATVPMPAGTTVTHFARGVHYDGAKDEEAIIMLVGEGPVVTTRAEE